LLPLALLVALALLAEAQSVRLGPRTETSVSFLAIVFAAVEYGGLAAMVVAGAGLLMQCRRPYLRWVTWTASSCLVAGLAGAVGHALFNAGSFGWTIGAVTVALAIEQIGAFTLTLAAASIRGVRLAEVTQEVSAVLLAIPLYAPVVSLLIYTFHAVSPWSAALFVLPALAAQRLFFLYQDQRKLTTDLIAANDQLERAGLSFATALVATLDARDRYTAGHSASVAIYARDIAERLGLSEKEKHLVHLAGLVHDIGKVGLPAGLLEKPGPLTLEERRQMEKHSEIGERILSNVDDYAEIAMIVRHHHERVDGHGYPDKLAGDDIPLASRIIAVADAYNAMTSDRPYRDAMPSRVARLRLAQGVESQFDTTVVAAFEAILATADAAYREGNSFDLTADVGSGRLARNTNHLAVAGAV
jgi:putative nucleotidyltransferase with HDIG domain